MSLPIKYQKEIIDKLINDFPLLVFNMKKDSKNKVLDKDQYFSAYFRIINRDKVGIDKQIKEFNKQFPLPYDRLMSFQTGRMIVDIDNLISDTYGKVLELNRHRNTLLGRIKDLSKENSELTTKLRQIHNQLQKMTADFNNCKKNTDKLMKIATKEKSLRRKVEKKCAVIESAYNKTVVKFEKESKEINTKIVVNDDDLKIIKKELHKLNNLIQKYANEADINLEKEMNIIDIEPKNRQQKKQASKKKSEKTDEKQSKKQSKKQENKGFFNNLPKFW